MFEKTEVTLFASCIWKGSVAIFCKKRNDLRARFRNSLISALGTLARHSPLTAHARNVIHFAPMHFTDPDTLSQPFEALGALLRAPNQAEMPPR